MANNLVYPPNADPTEDKEAGKTVVDVSADKISISPNSTSSGIDTALPYATENKTVAVLDWEKDDDPANPYNWPTGVRIFQTYIPAFYGFLFTFATGTCVPALPLIAAEFNIGQELSILPVSLFTMGLAIGPLIGAPLSEIYGRRPVYWLTLPWFLLFVGACGVAKNIQTLLVLRILSAITGSGALAVGAGTVSDIWPIKLRGPAALFFILCPFLGPVFAPLAGAYIVAEYNNDWRYTMWVILLVAAPIAIASIFLRETNKATILTTRAKKRGTHNAQIMTRSEKIIKFRIGILRPLHMLVVEPLVMLLSLYMGFSFAMVYSFFGSYRIIFAEVYNFDEKQIGLTFMGILVGFFIGVFLFGLIDKVFYAPQHHAAGGHPDAEHRLYPAMLGSFLLVAGLFWFAWSPSKHVHWIVPVLSGLPFGAGCLMLVISSTTYLVDAYPPGTSASAMAATSVFRYTLGGAFPLFTTQLYKSSTGIHWAGSIFAFIGVLLMPVPWAFFKYGKTLRAKSRYRHPAQQNL